MAIFSKQHNGSTAGGGNKRFDGNFDNLNSDKGTPVPDSDAMPGVIIGKKDNDIIIIFPDPGANRPGYVAPVDDDVSPADFSLSAGFSVGLYSDVEFPSVTIDVASIAATSTQTLISDTGQEGTLGEPGSSNDQDEKEAPIIISVIDSSGVDFTDARNMNNCDPIFLELSFESELDLDAEFYNSNATADAILYGNASEVHSNSQSENTSNTSEPSSSSSSQYPEPSTSRDIEFGEPSMTDAFEISIESSGVISSILNAGANAESDSSIDLSNSKWELSNINGLDDTLTSILGEDVTESSFGYYITDTVQEATDYSGRMLQTADSNEDPLSANMLAKLAVQSSYSNEDTLVITDQHSPDTALVAVNTSFYLGLF